MEAPFTAQCLDEEAGAPAWRNCAVSTTLEVIGGRWKSVIVFHLLTGMRRFNELQRLLGGITQRVLTMQLRELEADGIVERTVYAEVPPRVEYRLTPFGQSLKPVLLSLRDWGERHRAEVAALRA
ncbi:MAG: helix-turn-helix transcriptional regulator [Burkholderiales bacterium]|jgi:DNA-binding HxlR family transcriptional regulator|nr:helix-turn-helix transcriptional regulator [Burkholderiales bacterium]